MSDRLLSNADFAQRFLNEGFDFKSSTSSIPSEEHIKWRQKCEAVLNNPRKLTFTIRFSNQDWADIFHRLVEKNIPDEFLDFPAEYDDGSPVLINLLQKFARDYNRQRQCSFKERNERSLGREEIKKLAYCRLDWFAGATICNPHGSNPGMIVIHADKIHRKHQRDVFTDHREHFDSVIRGVRFWFFSYILSELHGNYATDVLEDWFKPSKDENHPSCFLQGDYAKEEFTEEQFRNDVTVIVNSIEQKVFTIQEYIETVVNTESTGVIADLSDSQKKEANTRDEQANLEQLSFFLEKEKAEEEEEKRLSDGELIFDEISKGQGDETVAKLFINGKSCLRLDGIYRDTPSMTPDMLREALLQIVANNPWKLAKRNAVRKHLATLPMQVIVDAMWPHISYAQAKEILKKSSTCVIKVTDEEFAMESHSSKALVDGETQTQDFAKDVATSVAKDVAKTSAHAVSQKWCDLVE
jgi:hypothetical protein